MFKSNVRAIGAESQQTFNEALANLESVVGAEVPITAEDKQGARPSEMEMSKLDFIINNVDKVDPELPKNFNNNVFAETKTLLVEKNRQLVEAKRVVSQIENQIAVVKIRYKANLRILYACSEASYKRDITLKYIYVNLQECYPRTKASSDDTNTVKTDETPK